MGLVPGRGILPIAASQDCAGPMCRTVADAAALLGVLTGETYGEGSGPDTLRGVRLAVPPEPDDLHADDAEVFRAALDVLRDRGAVLVEVPALPETLELPVLHYEFARDVDAYLATLPEGAPIRTMRDLAQWNEAHADAALKFGQAHVEKALAVDHEADRAAYEVHRARDLVVAGEQGIEAALRSADAAAVVLPGLARRGNAARAGHSEHGPAGGLPPIRSGACRADVRGPVAQRGSAAGPRRRVRGCGEGPQASVRGQPVAVASPLGAVAGSLATG